MALTFGYSTSLRTPFLSVNLFSNLQSDEHLVFKLYNTHRDLWCYHHRKSPLAGLFNPHKQPHRLLILYCF
jgi:hypothetical protein